MIFSCPGNHLMSYLFVCLVWSEMTMAFTAGGQKGLSPRAPGAPGVQKGVLHGLSWRAGLRGPGPAADQSALRKGPCLRSS